MSPVRAERAGTLVRIQSSPRDLLARTFPFAMRGLSLLSPEIAARVAERVFLTPPRFAAPEPERAFLATGHRFKIRGPKGKGQLTAWSWGDGPTVFLVHGWAGRGGQLHSFVSPLVEAGFSVVLFDAPAHGQSPGRQTSLVEFSQALFAAVEAAGPAAAVIAHSMGAGATAFALARGLQTSAVVFIAPPRSPQDYADQMALRLGLSPEVMARMQARIERRYNARWSELNLPELARTLCERSTARLLVVHDRDDRDTPYESGAAIARHWQGAELLSTQGLGHRRVLREPEVIERVVHFVSAP
jgi:pimeloyl-ACP methyl ester carboxylesterase